MTGFRGRHSRASMDGERYLRRAEPLREGIFRRTFRKIKNTTAAGMLSIFLAATAATVPSLSCNQNEVKKDYVMTKAGVTDANGHVSFEMGGQPYEITVVDQNTQQGIEDMIAILSVKDTSGAYFLLDKEGRYSPNIVGVSSENSGDAVVKSNVGIEKSENICNGITRFLTSGYTPGELFDDRQLPSDESIVQELFKAVEDSEGRPKRFSLNELDASIEKIIAEAVETAISEGIQDIALKGLVALGIKLPSRAVAGVNMLLLAMDMCALNEPFDWARHYRGLCYEDDDKFEIWKLKYVPELGIAGVDIISNPFILVIPVEKPNNWEAPIATISGKVINTHDDPNYKGLKAWLKHSEIPSVAYPIPWLNEESVFFFAASACENYNPLYTLEIKKDILVPLHVMPAITLNVKKDDHYDIAFYPNADCSWLDYSVYFKTTGGQCNKYDIAVSCFDIDGYTWSPSCSNVATWSRIYSFGFSSVMETADGFVLTGDGFRVLKTDSLGTVMWEYIIPPQNSYERDYSRKIIETSDGCVVAVGEVEKAGSSLASPEYRAAAVKIDRDGNMLWERFFDALEHAADVKETFDGNLIIAGSSASGAFLMKLDAVGGVLWENTVIPGRGAAVSVHEADGGYLLAGNYYDVQSQEERNFIAGTDSSGNLLWQGSLGQPRVYVESMEKNGDAFVAAGAIRDVDGTDAFVAALDSVGSQMWERRLTAPEYGSFHSVSSTKDGGLIATGAVGPEAGSWDIWLVKLDPEGNAVWEKRYGGEEFDIGTSVQETFDHGYVVAGVSGDGGWMIKTDPSGGQ